jgi:nickel-dependent lactate racemase
MLVPVRAPPPSLPPLEARVAEAVASSGLEAALAGHARPRIAVVVPDATRPLPLQRILPPLFARLRAQAPDAALTVVVALGLHRPLLEAEHAPLAALAESAGARLIEHRADRPDTLVTVSEDVGGLSSPLPARFARSVVEADLRIAVGLVEPHQYAGFSGGAKAIAIGCAAPETIGALHGLELLRAPGTRLASIDGNPMQAALWRLVAPLGAFFAVQLVPEPDLADLSVFAGPATSAHAAAVARASCATVEEVTRPWDWLHLFVPPAKAQSFYQASRAASYVALAEPSALRAGGTILLEASCPEGLGLGAGERSFARALARGPAALRDELATGRRALEGGEQRAFVLVRTLDRVRLELIGAPPMPALDAFGIRSWPDLETARAALQLPGEGATRADVFARVPRLRVTPPAR